MSNILAKPPGCLGCPWWQDGRGFVPDELTPGAKVLVMNQNPGEHEELGAKVVGYSGRNPITEPCNPTPAIGRVGFDLTTKYLPLAGLSRGENVSVGNVLRCRWQHKNDLPKDAKLLKTAIEHCQKAHFRIPPGTQLIVAGGAPASWALTGRTSLAEGEGGDAESGNTLSQWRGYLAPYRPPFLEGHTLETNVYTPIIGKDLPVLITNHIAFTYRAPLTKTPTKADYKKIPRILSGRWPVKLPEIEPDCRPEMWKDGIAFDTEYDPDTRKLHRYNVCTPEGRVWVVEAPNHVPGYVPSEPIRLIGQNFCSSLDLLLAEELGLTIGEVEDTMLMHAVLWPGYPHSLNYLGSLYARINRWKHLAKVSPVVYAGADAVGTLDVYRELRKEMDRDDSSARIYERYVRPLVRLIVKAKKRGLRVDLARAAELAKKLEAELEELSLRAGLEVGWPIQLSSNQQVAFQLYAIRGVKPPRKRRE